MLDQMLVSDRYLPVIQVFPSVYSLSYIRDRGRGSSSSFSVLVIDNVVILSMYMCAPRSRFWQSEVYNLLIYIMLNLSSCAKAPAL